MNTGSATGQDDPDMDAENPSQAMNDRLRGDVTSWMAARSEAAARAPEELSVPVTRSPAPRPAARAKPARSTPVQAEPTVVKKKPFGMSYDGMSQADYITYMISRGAR